MKNMKVSKEKDPQKNRNLTTKKFDKFKKLTR